MWLHRRTSPKKCVARDSGAAVRTSLGMNTQRGVCCSWGQYVRLDKKRNAPDSLTKIYLQLAS